MWRKIGSPDDLARDVAKALANDFLANGFSGLRRSYTEQVLPPTLTGKVQGAHSVRLKGQGRWRSTPCAVKKSRKEIIIMCLPTYLLLSQIFIQQLITNTSTSKAMIQEHPYQRGLGETGEEESLLPSASSCPGTRCRLLFFSVLLKHSLLQRRLHYCCSYLSW